MVFCIKIHFTTLHPPLCLALPRYLQATADCLAQCHVRIKRSVPLGWLHVALCYTSSGYFSKPSSTHIPAGQFSWEAWEVGIALELFSTVPGAVANQNIQAFFCSRCIQLCIYLLVRIFWSSWLFCFPREKTYSWRFGEMLCIRIHTCPCAYKYVCVCMHRCRGR